MADFLRNGVSWLADQLQAATAEWVVYCRGEKRVQLKATPAQVAEELLAVEEFDLRARLLDWIVRAGDLVIDGLPTRPQKGDRIETARIGGEVYEVAPLAAATECQPADAYGLQWRIHSKLVSS